MVWFDDSGRIPMCESSVNGFVNLIPSTFTTINGFQPISIPSSFSSISGFR